MQKKLFEMQAHQYDAEVKMAEEMRKLQAQSLAPLAGVNPPQGLPEGPAVHSKAAAPHMTSNAPTSYSMSAAMPMVAQPAAATYAVPAAQCTAPVTMYPTAAMNAYQNF